MDAGRPGSIYPGARAGGWTGFEPVAHRDPALSAGPGPGLAATVSPSSLPPRLTTTAATATPARTPGFTSAPRLPTCAAPSLLALDQVPERARGEAFPTFIWVRPHRVIITSIVRHRWRNGGEVAKRQPGKYRVRFRWRALALALVYLVRRVARGGRRLWCDNNPAGRRTFVAGDSNGIVIARAVGSLSSQRDSGSGRK